MAKPAVDPRVFHLAWHYAPLALVLLGGGQLFAQAPPGMVLPGGPAGPPAVARPAEMPMPGPPGPPVPGFPGEELVVAVQIEGNRAVKPEKILAQIHTRAGRPYDAETIAEDVARLNKMRMFVTVRPFWQHVPGGRVVIFRLVERPILQEVIIIGNVDIKAKKLKKEVGFKAGDAADPFEVEQGRQRLEDYYHKEGYSKVRVTILEGNHPGQLRAVYTVNEGPQQKVLWISVVGAQVVSSERIQTLLKTSRPILYIFKGEVDMKEIDEDVKRLTAYYRGLGFFQARVGREISFNPAQTWATITFVIDEGLRSQIRNIGINGNTKYSTEELMAKLKLAQGKPFDQGEMNADAVRLQDKYGIKGYVFAEVKGDLRYLEQPGQVDLVYNVNEGARYRVGRISVEIRGENPHTQWSTVLNRLSLQPGDIVDMREVKDSERRLKASGLYMVDMTKGEPPKIAFVTGNQNTDDNENGNQQQVADKPSRRGGYRGQSPDQPAPGERVVNIVYQYNSPEDLHQAEREAAAPQAPAAYNQPLPPPATYNQPLPPPPAGANWPPATAAPQPQELPLVIRGQYTTEFNPPADQTPSSGTPPAAGSGQGYQQQYPAAQQPYSSPQQQPYSPQPQQPYSPSQYTPPPPSQQFAPPRQYNYPPQQYGQQTQPAYAQPGYQQPAYNQPAGNMPAVLQPAPISSSGVSAGPMPGVARYPGDAPPPGPDYGQQPAAPCPPQYDPRVGPAPYVQPGPMGFGPQLPIFGPGSNYMDPAPTGDPLRDLELRIRAEEAQTGRIMVGVGVNSDSGLVGNLVLEERNFDWSRVPSSWEDVRDGTAWRGAGQYFRAEAVPGTEVQRYAITFGEPYWYDLEGRAVSLGLSGSYYERIFDQWTEQREGGRISLGYQITHDLTASVAFRAFNVNISNPVVPTPFALQEVIGNNGLYGFQVSLAHDTRDNQFLATEGHRFEVAAEEVVGTWNYPHVEMSLEQFYMLFERPDHSGRHVLSLSAKAGWTGDDTPIYERYYAGGYSSIRGFEFRGVSPIDPVTGVAVGGDFQLLGSIQYLFPITADDMLRGVFFVDAGTVEPTINDWSDKMRVAPGFGLRITIPQMGPAPIALDFAFPVLKAPGDVTQVFSFFVGFNH